MPSLFVRDEKKVTKPLPLRRGPTAIAVTAAGLLEVVGKFDKSTIYLHGGGTSVTWALLLARGTEARVNGFPAHHLGIRLLQHQDEISVSDGRKYWFSAEEEVIIDCFEDIGREVHCRRCMVKVETGETIVRCPGCGSIHHETKELPCWSGVPVCGSCDRSTAGGDGPCWSPADEEGEQ